MTSRDADSNFACCHVSCLWAQAQQQVQRDERCAEQAANDMSNLICEYRSTLARMKKQVDELHLRLEDTCQERESLQQQVLWPASLFVSQSAVHQKCLKMCLLLVSQPQKSAWRAKALKQNFHAGAELGCLLFVKILKLLYRSCP